MAIAERNYGKIWNGNGAIGRKLPRKKKRTHTEKKREKFGAQVKMQAGKCEIAGKMNSAGGKSQGGGT